VIILALLNDISMIPVAYDKAIATTKPQIPRAGKLIIQSLYFGLVHTALALIFIFSLNHHGGRDVNLSEQCDSETKGFIWFYLVLVTEISIFSVRSPSYFWKSMPSIILMASVILTCIIGALIAVFASDLKVSNMGYIIAYNVGIFIIVDIIKVQFRKLINEDPGDPIYTDDLIEVEIKTETIKYSEKQRRYRVHKEASLTKDEVDHQVRIRQDSIFSGFFGDIPLSDGFLNQSYGRRRAFSNLSQTGLHRDRRRTVSTPAGIGFY
jgi:H+-transporting ATPase